MCTNILEEYDFHKEEHRLKAFRNTVVKRIFGSKMDETVGC
jgi:hypothetical protein